MKKIVSALSAAAIAVSVSAAPMITASAEESWREAFITRIMKLMSSDPTHNEVALTDLDKNGVPECFIYRSGIDGGISEGFTLQNSSITPINVPGNIIGDCLADITVYEKEGRYIFVGREVPRYSSEIQCYKLEYDGASLTATRINKSDVSSYSTVPYNDIHGDSFLKNGYPDRSLIEAFVNSYDAVNTLTAQTSSAAVTVDGKSVDVEGYSVNYSNYYKIRDIAMVLRSTNAQFNVGWDESLSAITVSTGEKYQIIGGELEKSSINTTNDIKESSAPIYVDGVEHNVTCYNINGYTYFKIRDIADMAGFDVNWNEEQQLVEIITG